MILATIQTPVLIASSVGVLFWVVAIVMLLLGRR